MSVSPLQADFATILRLLDDETPAVRDSVSAALRKFEGDVSEALLASGSPLDPDSKSLLSELLQPGRRERLLREWIVPSDGIQGLHEDWDHCESMMRVISDFLHDGLTVRQPLGDALDFLADESENAYHQGGAQVWLKHFLSEGSVQTDLADDALPARFDLAAAASGARTHGLGAGILAVLVARRIGAPVTALDLPGKLMLVCDDELGGSVHDPGMLGEELDRELVVEQIRSFPKPVRLRCSRPASAGELLLRLVDGLTTALALDGRDEDALLMEKLLESLQAE
jgi:hypothetical protein